MSKNWEKLRERYKEEADEKVQFHKNSFLLARQIELRDGIEAADLRFSESSTTNFFKHMEANWKRVEEAEQKLIDSIEELGPLIVNVRKVITLSFIFSYVVLVSS
jgi:hypothetical protein